MNDLVSIITPAYNAAQFIGQTIDSVLAQTYTNWEMIIVDDCSTDNTVALIEGYNDPRIRCLKNPKNSGAAVSRNWAIREARGKWVAYLDSDDVWLPEKLEKQIRFMEETGCHFSYTQFTEMDDDGNPLGILWTGPKKISRLAMYSFNYMGCLTVMYDRDYVGLVQIENLKKRNDYAYWVKIVKKCPAYLLEEVLATYRIRSSGSLMDRSKGPVARIKYNYYMWRQGEGMGPVRALFWTAMNIAFGTLKKLLFKKHI